MATCFCQIETTGPSAAYYLIWHVTAIQSSHSRGPHVTHTLSGKDKKIILAGRYHIQACENKRRSISRYPSSLPLFRIFAVMKAVLIGLAGHAGLLGIAAVSSFGLLSNRNIFNNQSTASLDSVSVSNSTSNCTSYAVQSGDTCETIFYKTNATYAQLLRWNPDLSPSCK